MLKRLNDLSPAAWIQMGKKPVPKEPFEGVRVEACLPSVFPAYCKLFHPIYIDLQIQDHSISWHESEEQKHDHVGATSGGALVGESSYDQTKCDRVRWSELANRYGLKFHAEINEDSFTRSFRGGSWPRFLLGPDEGTLDRETCDALVSALSRQGGTPSCYFYYSGLSIAYDSPDGYAPRLYKGSLTDVPCLELEAASPEYWWPEDRQWCIHTDWDLSFTLVGGSGAIVDTIANDPLLETLPVGPRSRVDRQADQVNKGVQ
jgi:hypothetical protein